jgi:hypothetical protein
LGRADNVDPVDLSRWFEVQQHEGVEDGENPRSGGQQLVEGSHRHHGNRLAAGYETGPPAIEPCKLFTRGWRQH